MLSAWGPRKLWMRTVHRGLEAAAEAFFPPNDLGAPDWQQAEVVRRTLVWIDEMPPSKQTLLYSLFAIVELGTPILGPSRRRFSSLSVDKRVSVVNAWRSSQIYPVRLLGDSLKALLSMAYMSDPAALRFAGVYKTCVNPDDSFDVDIRENPLTQEPT